MFCVLTANIETKLEATSSFLKPFKMVTRYTSEETITEFETEYLAMDFVQSFLPFDKVFALPGKRPGLVMYTMWMGTGDECLHDLVKLRDILSTRDNINWEYYSKHAADLDESILESQLCEEDSDVGHNGKYKVGAYTSGNSTYLKKRLPFIFIKHIPGFKEFTLKRLTKEQQKMVILPGSINKKLVTVDLGKMFDLFCELKYKKHAKMFALWFVYSNQFLTYCYRLQANVTNFYEAFVLTFNQFRLKLKCQK